MKWFFILLMIADSPQGPLPLRNDFPYAAAQMTGTEAECNKARDEIIAHDREAIAVLKANNRPMRIAVTLCAPFIEYDHSSRKSGKVVTPPAWESWRLFGNPLSDIGELVPDALERFLNQPLKIHPEKTPD